MNITHGRISVIGGFLIGLGALEAMRLALHFMGVWGWFLLPIVLAIVAICILLVVCLPTYIEERRADRKYEKEHREKC